MPSVGNVSTLQSASAKRTTEEILTKDVIQSVWSTATVLSPKLALRLDVKILVPGPAVLELSVPCRITSRYAHVLNQLLEMRSLFVNQRQV